MRVAGAAADDPHRRAPRRRSAWGGSSTAPRSARRSRPRPTTPTSPASTASAPRRCRPLVWASPAAWPRCRSRSSPAQSGSAQNLDNLGPEHPHAGAGRRGHRRDGVVPAGVRRRHRHRRRPVADQLQLPRPAGPHRLPRVPVAVVDRRLLAEPAGRGETQTFSFAAKADADPRAAAPGLVGPPARPDRRSSCSVVGAVSCRWSSPSRRGTCSTRRSWRSRSARLSLTVLTGWAGQLSLGQMAFAGIGALLDRRLHPGHQRRHRVAATPASSRRASSRCGSGRRSCSRR